MVKGLLEITIFILLSQSAAADFFTTSKRRDLRADELGSIVEIRTKDGICTGFRVKNNQSKLYIATARHCLDYQATRACQESSFYARGLSKNLDFKLTCQRIVAASHEDDMMIFEANIVTQQGHPHPRSSEVLNFLRAFRLADYYPVTYIGLRMAGFPGDKFQSGKPTMTERCNVQPAGTLDILGQENTAASGPETFKPILGAHNCNVYGGNSGGPIFITNSNDVIAMPASYYPQQYKKGNYDNASMMELTKGFVDRNRQRLTENGVSLSSKLVSSGASFQWLKLFHQSLFVDPEHPSVQFRLSKIDQRMGFLEISFSEDGGKSFGAPLRFPCEADGNINHFCYLQSNPQAQDGRTWRIEPMLEGKIRISVDQGANTSSSLFAPR